MSAPSAPTTPALPAYLDMLLTPLAAQTTVVRPTIAAANRGDISTGQMFARLGDRVEMLSSGEQFIVELALALWNGAGTARVADLSLLDKTWRHRAATAIIARFSPLWGKE